ncbi:hypothetical protein M758_3G208400 [Ceratodon purpureus]|nr:hypothetical protein M758_3G208400 [Ceratodon purpureus]
MSESAEGEGTCDGHSLIPSINEKHVSAQDGPSSSTKSLTEGAPGTTLPINSVVAVLELLPVSRQSQPPKVPPKIDASHGQLMVKGKGREEELQDKVYSLSNLEASYRLLVAELKPTDRELVLRRIFCLQNQSLVQQQPRYKDSSSELIRKVKAFNKEHRKYSLEEILSKATDVVFLHQLLDGIYSLDTEKVTMSPSMTNSPPTSVPMLEFLTTAPPPTSDPVLEFLTTAPSCHHRVNARALLPPILDENVPFVAGDDAWFEADVDA